MEREQALLLHKSSEGGQVGYASLCPWKCSERYYMHKEGVTKSTRRLVRHGKQCYLLNISFFNQNVYLYFLQISNEAHGNVKADTLSPLLSHNVYESKPFKSHARMDLLYQCKSHFHFFPLQQRGLQVHAADKQEILMCLLMQTDEAAWIIIHRLYTL